MHDHNYAHHMGVTDNLLQPYTGRISFSDVLKGRRMENVNSQLLVPLR